MTRTEQTILTRRLLIWAALVLLGGKSARAELPGTDRLGDPLPPGAVARLGTMRLRHDSTVVTLAFAPDGKTLASGDGKGVIRIWETVTGHELRCLRDQWSNSFGVIAYSPNGKVLASGGGNGVTFWDPATGAKLDRFGRWNEDVVSLAFAPDGKTLAASTREAIVWWEVGTGVRLRSLDDDHDSVVSIAYSPDGKTLAYARINEEIGLCDAATGKEVRKLRNKGRDSITYRPSVAYSPDGKKLLVRDEHCWRLLDAASGKELTRDDGPPFYAPPDYAPNGQLIATMTAAWEKWPRVWDLTQNKGHEFRGRGRAGDAHVAVFSPDSKLLASGGTDGRVRLWDVVAGREVDWPAGDALGGDFSLSRDGKILASLDGNSRMRLRDTASGKLLHHWDAPADVSYSYVALSPDGSQAVVAEEDGEDGQLMWVVDAATGRRRWRAKARGYIRFAAYSPDGSLLASPDGNCNLNLWDTVSGRRLDPFVGHASAVVAGVFAPDGKTLVTASLDHTLRVWDVAERRERHRLKGHGGGATVSHIVFSADGTRLATGGDDGRICVWDARSGRRLHRWAMEEDNVTCLALSSDGKLLVANAEEGCFRLWDVATGKASPPIEGHRGAVTFAAFLPDDRTLLTAGREGTALIWEVAALRQRQPQATPARTETIRLGTLRLRHRGLIGCVVYSPDGKILASAPLTMREKEGVHLWDTASGREIHQLAKGRRIDVRRMRFSPDGKVLATVSSGFGNTIWLWDVASGTSLGAAARHPNGIHTFAFTPDGKTLAIAADEVYLQDLDTGERVRTFEKVSRRIDQIAFTADGETLVAVGLDGVCILDIATGKSRRCYEMKGRDLVLAPDGQVFAYHDEDMCFHVCAAATGEELWRTKKNCFDCTFSPNGKLLLTISSHEPFRLHETATGKEIRHAANNTNPVPPAAEWFGLSPDGGTLAVKRDARIELWDVASGRERRPTGGHSQAITCLDFAPDGRTLVSGSEDGTLRLWDAIAGKELRVLRASEEYIKCVAFSRDGKTIASGDTRNIIRLWNAATGAEQWRFEGPFPNGGSVQSVAFAPDGRTLIAGNSKGTVYLWDNVTHKLRRQFQGFSSAGTAIAISPDGNFLASVGRDAPVRSCGDFIIRLWDAATGRRVREIDSEDLLRLFPITFSPDGKLLVARRIDSRIGFWELASGKKMFHIDTAEHNAGFSPDGRCLITRDGTLWDMGTGKEVGQLRDCEQGISALAISRDGRWIATGSEDATILVQLMPRPARPPSLLPHEPTKGELLALWTALSAADPARAWPAMRTFTETPRRSLPFLRTVLRPHPPIDRRRLKPLLADLDSDRFVVREQARKELAGFGELAEAVLLQVLNDKPSLEVRRRVLALLEDIENERKSPDSLRRLRSTTILERIGTGEAVNLLRHLASGTAEARVSREAAAALERLTRRSPKP